ncbi:MAG: hypothetical protein ACKVS8_00680 [Phycisphaerales bacterium]
MRGPPALLLPLVSLLVLALSGCKSGLMAVAPDNHRLTATADSAVVVFMRPSVFGGAIQSSVFDVTSTQNEFVGIISSGTSVAYRCKPGERTFMVVSEAGDFLKASVDAGKTYYALVTPRIGFWKARFSLKPLRTADLAGSDFLSWEKSLKFYENTDASRQWAIANAADIQRKRDEYLPKWNAKPPDDKAAATLLASDGR